MFICLVWTQTYQQLILIKLSTKINITDILINASYCQSCLSYMHFEFVACTFGTEQDNNWAVSIGKQY